MNNIITLRLAMAQANFTVGDLKTNSEKIVRYINESLALGSDIVTFPELALTGYPPEDLILKKQFVEDNLLYLKRIADSVKNIVAVVGFVNRSRNDIYNSAALIYKGKIRGIYDKMLLPNYGVFDEKRYFSPGKKALAFNVEGVVCGVNICEDIWHSELTVKGLKSLGVKLILNINASPYYAGKINLREAIIKKAAKDTAAVVSYNNLVGGQDELVFDGQSLLVDGKGNVLTRGGAFKEDLIVFDINFKKPQKTSSKKIVNLDYIVKNKKIALHQRNIRKPLELEEIYSALVLGLRDYVRKNNFKKVVLGLSGGIDSSLTAAIASDALGKENVYGVFMPSGFTSKESFIDAKELVDNLGIEFHEIPITGLFEKYIEVLKEIFKGLPENIAEENLQARIRGNILMSLSNKFGYIVLTTGNKSEVSCGYCTLYGDTAGGFAVLKDVTKMLVYRLSEYRNTISRVIPEHTITREPTAELAPNQKDADSLPPYDVLDKILKLYVEEDSSIQDIVKIGFDKGLVERVIMLVDNNEYKRRQAPPGVKITPKAFGRDRRMPITNRYKIDNR